MLSTLMDIEPIRANAASILPAIYFDYSDLVAYFRHNRFPTGIQRVQIEFFKTSLEWDSPVPIRSCTYAPQAGFWVDIDAVGFRKLCGLASTPGSHHDTQWQGALHDFLVRTETRPACVMPEGAALVNLGASWWMKDYMPLIREAKAKYGIRYIPLIYDLIPIITPEYCDQNLVSAFSYWISSVFVHADLLAAISRCTRDDVIRAAEAVQPLACDPIVMTLDAEFGVRSAPGSPAEGLLLDGYGLRAGFYILVVGTLELRKNQLLIFQAWAKLVSQHGAAKIPTLVCAGKIGHGFDVSQNFIEAHPEVRDKLVVLSGLSDIELNALYAGCLFTIFSSTYEGWGLPITESLCHGKICLSADHSSLPEAGGPFVEFFESESVKSLIQHAEKLLFDTPYRAALERRIGAEFKPRSWQAVMEGLVDAISAHFRSPARAAPVYAPVTFGNIYELRQDRRLRQPDRRVAVAEMLRDEGTWHSAAEWGSWARTRHARLAFILPPLGKSTDDIQLQLKLRAPNQAITLTVKVGGVTQTVAMSADEHRLLHLVIPWRSAEENQRGHGAMVVHLMVDKLVPADHGDDAPLVGIGCESLALCRTDDIFGRLRIIERNLMMSDITMAAG
jgi:glycosyltransferase involved in cell wall biosynthesis